MSIYHREQLLTLGIVLMLTCAFVFGLAWPRHRQLQAVHARQQELHEKHVQLMEENKQIDGLSSAIHELEQEMASAHLRIPSEDHIALYEQQLWAMGKELDLETPRSGRPFIDYGDRQMLGNIVAMPFTLSFEQNFDVFCDVLRRLEQHDKLTEITGLSIKPVTLDGRLLDISMDLNIFYGRL